MLFFRVFCFLLLGLKLRASAKKDRLEGYESTPAESYFTKDELLLLEKPLLKFQSVPSQYTWQYAEPVSTKNPFIFFHQRKAGGTRTRQHLEKFAIKKRLPYFLPCFGKVICDTLTLPYNKPYAIYGAHFPWGEQRHLSRFRHRNVEQNFSCVTNMREPVSRLFSCVAYRFLAPLKSDKCVSDLSDKEFIDFLTVTMDKFGGACLNEPFRIMSGITDEVLLQSLGRDIKLGPKTLNASISNRDAVIFDITLENLSKCAPRFLETPLRERADSLLRMKFPEMYAHGAFDIDTEGYNHSHCAPPRDSQIAIAERLGAFEKLFYNAVRDRVLAASAELNRRSK